MRLKKFVTINKFSSKTGIGVAFNELRKGINRTGVVTDGIGSCLLYTSQSPRD